MKTRSEQRTFDSARALLGIKILIITLLSLLAASTYAQETAHANSSLENYLVEYLPVTSDNASSQGTSGVVANDTQDVSAKIEDSATPLVHGNEAAHVSLVNLAVTIHAVFFLLLYIGKIVYDRLKRTETRTVEVDAAFLASLTPEKRAIYEKKRMRRFKRGTAEQKKESTLQKYIKINLVVAVIAGIAAIEAIVLLMLTQDFNAVTVGFDSLSPLFFLTIAVQLLAPFVVARFSQ